MAPPRQRLKSHEPPIADANLRLIEYLEPAVRNGDPQVLLERPPGTELLGHARFEGPICPSPGFLGAVERDIGAVRQRLGIGPVVREHGDADARAHRNGILPRPV